jgi:hypothetical protein
VLKQIEISCLDTFFAAYRSGECDKDTITHGIYSTSDLDHAPQVPRFPYGNTVKGTPAMARAAKKAAPRKARGGTGTKARPTSKKSTSAKKVASAQKAGAPRRIASKRRSPKPSAGAGQWLGAVSNLVGTLEGREIVADVLEAAAAALRKGRRNVASAVEAGTEQVLETAETATNVATEVAAGTASLAGTAAGVLAEAVADVAHSVLPGGSAGADAGREPGRRSRRRE